MIKCEVVFDGDNVIVGSYVIYKSGCTGYGVYNLAVGFDTLEEAIKYCLEN